MSWSDVTPAAFAATWGRRNRNRWDAPDDLGAQVRRLAGARPAFPGAPATAFVGFCSNAGRYEDTGAPIPGTRTIRNCDFHEIGYFNVEGGYTFDFPISGTMRVDQQRARVCRNAWDQNSPSACPLRAAPDPNVRHPWTNYARLGTHAHMSERDFVGHPASLAPGAWRTNLDEQVGVGLLNLRYHGNRVATISGLTASQPGTLWAVFMGFSGWSAGDGTIALHMRPFARDLNALPGPMRLGALVLALATRIQGGAAYRGMHHSNPVWTVLRATQRLRAGRMLQRELGLPDGWYDLGLGGLEGEDTCFDVLARAAAGQPRERVTLPSLRTAPAGDVLGAVVDALAAPVLSVVPDPLEEELVRFSDVGAPVDYLSDADEVLFQTYGAKYKAGLTPERAQSIQPVFRPTNYNGQ